MSRFCGECEPAAEIPSVCCEGSTLGGEGRGSFDWNSTNTAAVCSPSEIIPAQGPTHLFALSTSSVSGERLRILLLVEQPGLFGVRAGGSTPQGASPFRRRLFPDHSQQFARQNLANKLQSVVKFTATSRRAFNRAGVRAPNRGQSSLAATRVQRGFSPLNVQGPPRCT